MREPTGAWIVVEASLIVHPASSNATRTSHFIALRYEHSIFETSSHYLKVWQDGFHQRTSLLELGFCFYISHQQTPCPSSKSPKQILVIDLNGAHLVNVEFCACEGSTSWVEDYRQLLRIGWYPASFDRPQTAFTFDLLDTYHKITLQGKLNLYDFYLSTMQKTDNCGRKKIIVSFIMANIDHRTDSLCSTDITRFHVVFANGAR